MRCPSDKKLALNFSEFLLEPRREIYIKITLCFHIFLIFPGDFMGNYPSHSQWEHDSPEFSPVAKGT